MPYSVMLLKTWERLIKQEGLMKFRKFVAKVKDMKVDCLLIQAQYVSNMQLNQENK